MYALIALGYSMVYGVLKLLNFAHGDVYMVGAFIGFGTCRRSGLGRSVVPVWLLLIDHLCRRHGRLGGARRRHRALRLSAAAQRTADSAADQRSGVSFFLTYSMQLMFGSTQRNYDAFAMADGALFFRGIDIGNVKVPLLRIIIIGSAFMLMIVLWLLVNRTRTGKAMRATSHDREAAAMMGIDIDRVIVFTFLIGSALAGAAGVMFSLRATAFVNMGFTAGLKGFTAAVIGGIGSIPGAMFGGLLLGFLESFTQGYISTRWSDLIVFSVLILFMLFRPQGLFGRADIKKV